MDLHGHQYGPCKADFRGPLVKKGPQGPSMVLIGTYIDLLTTDKLEFTAWFEVNPTFGSGVISY